MEVKSEADSNDITESLQDDKPSVGMFVVFLFSAVIPLCMLSKYFHF